MIDVKSIVLLSFLVVACGGQPFEPELFGAGGAAAGAGGAGTGGSAGAAGAGGVAGAEDSGVDAVEASDPCGPLMLLSGSVCVDKRPALHADGNQGSAVSFAEAVAICEGRGARLCTEAEREGACPGGQEPAGGANAAFCTGPANTWEWSDAPCAIGHCLSPCCNASQNKCQCESPTIQQQSFRCCKNV